MDFAALTADELDVVLHYLSAKQLSAVMNTSRELRTAARRALNASRFAERKRWAALGVGLLRVCQQGGHCCADASKPSAKCTTDALASLVAFETMYWRRSERPAEFGVPALTIIGEEVGFGLTFTETDTHASARAWDSVSAVGSGYLKAVGPSRCVLRMAGPMEGDCQHVVPSWLAHVMPMWGASAPDELEAAMHAMQDWPPQAFAYVMLRQTVMRFFASYANSGVGRTVADCAALRGSPCPSPMAPHAGFVSEAQVRHAVEALVSEGHLYSTVDEQHYKATFP